MLDRPLVAAALPGYEVTGEIGRGGLGVVLAARHNRLGREVAVKFLPRAFAADDAARERFVAEATLLASVDHPHIVPVYDFVEHDGVFLLLMENLAGGSLWSRFADAGLTARTSVALLLACLTGLDAAHGRGILHRDIKPENLLFNQHGTLKVTDFGIATTTETSTASGGEASEIVGTPAYIAPEQTWNGVITPAADVYAAATVLYELLCGELPFQETGDPMDLLYQHAYEQPDPLRTKNPELPEAVAEVVMLGLRTDHRDRPSSAMAFGLALASAATDAWGAGWLSATDVPIHGAPELVAVTERGSRQHHPGPGGRSDPQAPSHSWGRIDRPGRARRSGPAVERRARTEVP